MSAVDRSSDVKFITFLGESTNGIKNQELIKYMYEHWDMFDSAASAKDGTAGVRDFQQLLGSQDAMAKAAAQMMLNNRTADEFIEGPGGDYQITKAEITDAYSALGPTSGSNNGVVATELSQAAINANPAIGKYAKEIAAAAKATGLDANLIAAQIWAESRGHMDTHTKNVDGTFDHGLMQIGNERWRNIAAGLSAEDKAKIKAATGEDAEKLDVEHNALHNVVAGAYHLKGCIDHNPHKPGDVQWGLRFYNSGTAHGAGSAGYVKNVMAYMEDLQGGRKLREDPYDATNGTGNGDVL